MANKNEIIISLDEYKELLLKDKPNNTDVMLLDRIKQLLLDHIEYYKNYYDKVEIRFEDSSDFNNELLTTIKIIDKDFYKQMIKQVCDDKRKKDEENTNMEKARAIKDIDKE